MFGFFGSAADADDTSAIIRRFNVNTTLAHVRMIVTPLGACQN